MRCELPEGAGVLWVLSDVRQALLGVDIVLAVLNGYICVCDVALNFSSCGLLFHRSCPLYFRDHGAQALPLAAFYDPAAPRSSLRVSH